RAKPHSSVGTLGNRTHPVRHQSIRCGVRREVAAVVLAYSAAKRRGPYRAIAILMHRIDTILWKPICLSERPRGDRAIDIAEMRYPAPLTSHPQVTAAASEGIDNIVSQLRNPETFSISVVQALEATFDGCKPEVIFVVDVQRPYALRLQPGSMVGGKCALVQARKLAATADP